MIDKKHIEQFLLLNGLTIDAPEDAIRSLLVDAGWHDEDAAMALKLLRDEIAVDAEEAGAAHKTLSSDHKIKPETLASLLGVDVEVESVTLQHHESLDRKYRSQLFSIVVFSVIGALIFLLAAMWYMQVGVFHEYALQF